MTQVQNGLNNTQITLLRLFDKGLSKKEETDISNMLMDYYEKELHEELEQVIKEKGITQKDLDAVLKRSNRTKNKANESSH